MNFKYILSLSVFSIVFLQANAQDDLSLSQAISTGLERHYDIRIEQQNVAIAEMNNNWSLAFPRLTADIRGSRTVFDNRENLNPFSLLGEITTNQIQPTVNVNWDLLSIANISIGKRQLETLEAESQGNADIVVANALQAIILGYYTAVLQERRLDEFQRQLNLSRDKYELQKIKQEIGSAVTTDVLLEEGNYLTDSGNYVNQLLIYQNAISNLNFLLAEPDPAKQYNFTDDLEFEYNDLSYEDLVQQMEQQNVDLKKQYLTQSVLGYTTRLRKLDRYPTLSLGGSYSLTRNNQEIDGQRLNQDGGFTPFVASGNNENANFGLNFLVSFNLFDGGRVNRAIKEAIIREDIGNIRTEQLKASLSRDLVQALDQYKVRKQIYDINERRFQAAEQNLRISEEKFRNGTINSFDYRTVQNNQLSAAIVKLQSTYNLLESQVQLLRLTGGLMQSF